MTLKSAPRRIRQIALLVASLMIAAVTVAQTDELAEAGKLFRGGQQAQADGQGARDAPVQPAPAAAATPGNDLGFGRRFGCGGHRRAFPVLAVVVSGVTGFRGFIG